MYLARTLALTGLAAASTALAPLAAQGSPLIVRTNQERLAYRMVDQMGNGGDLPELGQGQSWQVALDDGGTAVATAVDGDVGMIEIEAQPAALMKIFAAQVGQAQGMAQGMASFGLGQAGIPARDAVKIVRAAFDLPMQIDRLTLKVVGDPKAPEQGMQIDVGLTPKADTWLASLVGAMQPTGKGAPAVGNPGAGLQMQVDADLGKMADVMEPFNAFMAGIGADSKEIAATREKMLADYWAALGQGMAVSWDFGGSGMEALMGVAQGDILEQLVQSEAYREWAQAMSSMAPGVEVEVTPAAMTHRGVKVLRSVTILDEDAPPNPMMPDGEMTAYSGVAGGYLVALTGGEAGDVKALIDRAIDGKVTLEKLPANTFARAHLKLAEMMDVMTQGMVPAGEVPEEADVTIKHVNGSLQLHITAR